MHLEGTTFAFALALLAGLATLVGFLLSVVGAPRSGRFLSVALSFAGGAMLFVAFGEILGKAAAQMEPRLGATQAGWAALLGFFGGIAASFAVDRALPLHLGAQSGTRTGSSEHARLARMGTFAAIAIGLHNFPEGVASFVGALEPGSSRFALPFAIALHNVPEGIAIAAPVYRATGSRSRAFVFTFAAALAEPLGALVAWFALGALEGSIAFGLVFASVAGIMVYIAVDELLPAAREHGDDASATGGFVLGMAVMASSLQLLR